MPNSSTGRGDGRLPLWSYCANFSMRRPYATTSVRKSQAGRTIYSRPAALWVLREATLKRLILDCNAVRHAAVKPIANRRSGWSSRDSRPVGIILIAFGAVVLALLGVTGKGGGLGAIRFALTTDARHFHYLSKTGHISDVWSALENAERSELSVLIDLQALIHRPWTIARSTPRSKLEWEPRPSVPMRKSRSPGVATMTSGCGSARLWNCNHGRRTTLGPFREATLDRTVKFDVVATTIVIPK